MIQQLPSAPAMASPQEARVPGPRRERVDRAVAEIDRFIANLKSELGVLVQTSTPTTKAIDTTIRTNI